MVSKNCTPNILGSVQLATNRNFINFNHKYVYIIYSLLHLLYNYPNNGISQSQAYIIQHERQSPFHQLSFLEMLCPSQPSEGT